MKYHIQGVGIKACGDATAAYICCIGCSAALVNSMHLHEFLRILLLVRVQLNLATLHCSQAGPPRFLLKIVQNHALGKNERRVLYCSKTGSGPMALSRIRLRSAYARCSIPICGIARWRTCLRARQAPIGISRYATKGFIKYYDWV
jgi:hypothetical protein